MANRGGSLLLGVSLALPILASACSSEVVVVEPTPAPSVSGTGAPKAPKLGLGDGTPSTVSLTVIADASAGLKTPTDLDFNPMKPTELWVVSFKDDSIVTITDAPTDARAVLRRRDAAATHFMPNPTGIAFGGEETTFGIPGTFAACGESRNERANGSANDFMGPALWSSDPTVYALSLIHISEPTRPY